MQALERQALPPSANCSVVDPALDLDVVSKPGASRLRHAMSNSFGFGGSNCTLVFSQAQ
jgi:3-oxoacyl-(acyl-carrier-protein) synthase